MGEYVNLDGVTVKLGTCEDLFYTRFDQLKAAIAAGSVASLSGNLDPADYLGDEFRFRFPFPDEDGVAIGAYDPYNRAVAMTAPAELVKNMEHDSVSMHFHAQGGGHGVTVFATCPQSPRSKGSASPLKPVLELVQQRPIEGELFAVVQCPYCQYKARLTRPDVLAWREHVQAVYWQADDTLRQFYDVLFERALAGYTAAGEEP